MATPTRLGRELAVGATVYSGSGMFEASPAKRSSQTESAYPSDEAQGLAVATPGTCKIRAYAADQFECRTRERESPMTGGVRDQTPVLVLGVGITVLGAMRCLGRRGIPL